MKYTFEHCRADYVNNWHEMAVRPRYAAAVAASARKILQGRDRYMAVARETGVPWFVIGIIHKMECNCDFGKHLHNGDSLRKRTWRVPAGRPKSGKPPFAWEESAIDAIRYDKLDHIKKWSVEVAAFAFEKYNGFGSRRRGVPSAYLWSFSTVYTRGKFVRDHVWDANAISEQTGAMVLMKELFQLQPSLALPVGEPTAVRIDEDSREGYGEEPPLRQSRTVWGGVLAGFGAAITWAWNKIGLTVDAVGNVAGDVIESADGIASSAGRVAELVGLNLPYIGAAALIAGLYLVIYARTDARRNGKVG